MTDPTPDNPPAEASPLRFQSTDNVQELLSALGVSLAVTTYQAGKLAIFRAGAERLSGLFRTFDSAMGLAIGHNRMAIGSRNMIWFLRNAPDVGRKLEPHGRHDGCFLPRSAHVTGDIRIHEMAWCRPTDHDAAAPLSTIIPGVVSAVASQSTTATEATMDESRTELWFVNTRFSCLCTLNHDYSFVPRWKPPFISSLEAEDRCHLNGLATFGGRPRFVTALGETDAPGGWRDNKARGGLILDLANNAILTRGLAMPHSPRVHDGHLYVLNSGHGALEIVEGALEGGANAGRRSVIAQLPGYARGLALIGKYAFIGLSRIREKREFGGLPIENLGDAIRCGVWIVDITSGRIVGFIEFTGGVEEIFDVQILPHLRFPAVIGLEKQTLNNIFILPDPQAAGE